MSAQPPDERVMPVVLAVDVEPEPGGGTWRDARPWRGFERWLEVMPELRGKLEKLTGAPVHFAWFVRCDPQIADIYGDAAWAADRYSQGFDALRAAGDEIAIHPHAWRWDAGRARWLHDNADPAWVEHVLETGFGRFAAAFGQPARAHRFGSRFLTAAIVHWLIAHGVRVDTTLEPGTPPLRTLDVKTESTGIVPDQRGVPRQPYRPDPDDPFQPAAIDSLPPGAGLWMLPHSAFDPQRLIPAWRQVARRVRFFGQARYRPAQLWTPQDPAGFWDLALAAAHELPQPYLLLAARSSALFDAEPARHTMGKLDALQRHPAVSRMRFLTALEALDSLVGAQ
ncbi:MAG: hypothetical protein QOJ81_1193 [Chloroflexota bacterium]|jgi:hypothetical protein|nr:hypothetical protein [Chloroflexota bacterium]